MSKSSNQNQKKDAELQFSVRRVRQGLRTNVDTGLKQRRDVDTSTVLSGLEDKF